MHLFQSKRKVFSIFHLFEFFLLRIFMSFKQSLILFNTNSMQTTYIISYLSLFSKNKTKHHYFVHLSLSFSFHHLISFLYSYTLPFIQTFISSYNQPFIYISFTQILCTWRVQVRRRVVHTVTRERICSVQNKKALYRTL